MLTKRDCSNINIRKTRIQGEKDNIRPKIQGLRKVFRIEENNCSLKYMAL